jgi:pimeloyl-ACP methyl ester carboxylesterase
MFSYNPKPSWESILEHYDMSYIIQILGYDPHMSVYAPVLHGGTTNEDQVTVYVHGWGDSQKSIEYFQRNSLFLPGTIVGFNFKDANFGSYLPPYKNSNFCQSDDIATLVLTLKILDECNVNVIHLFGHSRGGGTIITMLARLARYKKYMVFFRKLGISKEQAERIISKIRAGTIILNCPLVHIHSSIKEKLNWLKIGFLTPIIRYCVLPIVTGYHPRRDNPLQAAKTVQKLDIPLLVHFQKDSLILGNSSDAKFYEHSMGPQTYLVTSNDGYGHVHTSNTLSAAIQAFHKKHGGAYYIIPPLIAQGQKLLEESPLSPESIQYHIQRSYAQPTVLPKKCSSLIHHTKNITLPPIAEIKKYLGYNPTICIYPADIRTKGESITVYAHGYGENPQAMIPFFHLNSYLLPGTILSFNFPDVIPGTFIPNIKQSNLGQETDIKSLVYILKILDAASLDTINIFGCSRGGATTINTLARLCRYTEYSSFFANLDISPTQAKRILYKIKNGTIILNVPLVDTYSVAYHWFGHLSSFILNHIIPRISKHKPKQDQAIESAKIIQSMHFNILVHFEYGDRIVGNKQDAQFYKNIMGPHTYLVLANDGGHGHSGKTLGAAIQAFNKRYGQSYYPYADLLAEGNSLLAQGQPSQDYVDAFVRNTYATFAPNAQLT